jgi:hypothetical protein
MSRSRDIAAGSTRVEYIYTATADQTTFTGSDSNSNTLSYTVGLVEVFLNGTRLSAADFTATNGTSVVLASGADVNDIINIVAYGVFSVADRVEQRTEFDYTATSGQTTFTGADNDGETLSYTAGKIDVYLNGSHLNVTDDYVASNGTSVVLQSGATAGDILHIVNHGTTSLIGNFVDGETLDVNGNEIILDADGDTSITADTDDRIDFKVGGTDRVILSPTKIQMKSSGNAELELQAGASDSDNSLKYLNSSGSRRGFISYDTDNDFMFIGTSNAEKFRIDSSGNVGIGFTSLTSKLTVNRDQSSGVADLLTLRDGSAGATFNMQTYADPSFGTANRFDFSGAYLAFRRSGTEAMRIDSSANVTIDGNTVLTDAAKTLSQNGYQKFSNGYTIQWGKHTSSSSSFTVNFPVSFTTVYSVVLTPFDTGTDTGGVGGAESLSPDSNVGNSSFKVSHYTPMEGIYWIATGIIS